LINDPLATPTVMAMAGDWHMNPFWGVEQIHWAGRQGATVIIHTGDFAYTFDVSFLQRISKALRGYGMALLFVDGNHENHARLHQWPIGRDGLRRISPGVYHLPRGFRWTWNGVRFLALGGAHSVDRNLRKPYVSWWPEETIGAGDAARAMRGGPADVMISHDCPAGVPIPGLQSHLFDAAEIALSERHRELLAGIVQDVQVREIWHGHYHVPYSTVADLGYGPVLVTGLDCDATSTAANMRIVAMADIVARHRPRGPAGPTGLASTTHEGNTAP
jgi:predicted phosphodiesterase